MTSEEHHSILRFVETIKSNEQAPIDVEADAIIRALFVRNPDLAYRMTIYAMAASAPQVQAVPSHRVRQRSWFSWLLRQPSNDTVLS